MTVINTNINEDILEKKRMEKMKNNASLDKILYQKLSEASNQRLRKIWELSGKYENK